MEDNNEAIVPFDMIQISNVIHRVIFCLLLTFFSLFVCFFIVRENRWGDITDVQAAELKKLLRIYLTCLITYFLIQGSDPGYIPRHSDIIDCEAVPLISGASLVVEPEEAIDSDVIAATMRSDQSIQSRRKYRDPNESGIDDFHLNSSNNNSSMTAADQQNPYYCSFCESEKPIRSQHCHVCRRCVSKLDHHCHMMHTCIGEKNHFRFYLFICVHLYAIIYAWMTSIYSITFSIWAVFLFIVLSVLLLFVASLVGFHSWLVLTASTSFESAKGSRIFYLKDANDCDLPFARCCLLNIWDFGQQDALLLWISRFVLNVWFAVCLGLYRVGCQCNSLRRKCWLCPDENQLLDTSYQWWDITWTSVDAHWKPRRWTHPGPIVRDSEDICAHPWQNKYYSCC